MPGNKQRDWCFTDNCPKHWLALPKGVKYLVWQLEKGTHIHHQGYIELNSQQRVSWLRKNISDTACWLIRAGTPEVAAHYCKKPVIGCECKHCKKERIDRTKIDGPWELGTPRAFRKNQGLRTDLENYRDAIWSGKRKAELMESDLFLIAKYPRLYNAINLARMPRRKKELKVILGIGTAGIGKTRWGFDQWSYRYGAPEDTRGAAISYWRMPANNGKIWFDGYDRHQIAQIDDFCGKMSCCRLDMLLHILDRYPEAVPVKNSHAWWLPEVIYLTTNIHPVKWYTWDGRRKQRFALQRRFTQVLDFDKMVNGKPTEIDLRTWDWDQGEDNGMIIDKGYAYGSYVHD